ncbi:MAG: alpha-amylase family glycosyl hydrolase, partial [Bacilli bacterium]|nr:alpha-amylase family glycosyl hydrolase [Bacilli bacterium]
MKKRFFSFLFITFLSLSCHPNQTNNYPLDPDVTNVNGSVFYEIFVGSFCDSNHDGVGDLRGIASKLDYLEDLGIKGLWLTPIHPSDTYHKYDVKDYLAIEKEFGTLDDFDYLISEANKRHIDIILDLVINHSSSNHEWFKDAEKDKRDNVLDPTSKRFYYNWSDTQQKGYRYSNVAQSYYEGQFDTSMPDLNLDNEYVINEIGRA